MSTSLASSLCKFCKTWNMIVEPSIRCKFIIMCEHKYFQHSSRLANYVCSSIAELKLYLCVVYGLATCTYPPINKAICRYMITIPKAHHVRFITFGTKEHLFCFSYQQPAYYVVWSMALVFMNNAEALTSLIRQVLRWMVRVVWLANLEVILASVKLEHDSTYMINFCARAVLFAIFQKILE